MLTDFTTQSLDFMSTLFVFDVGLAVLVLLVLFLINISQTRDAIRRNYPVIGRFRYRSLSGMCRQMICSR